MVKFRLFFDKDKETDWLNEWAEKGYAMTGFCAGFYTFDATEPGKYRYQIDFTEGFFQVSESYREFMDETGVEIVCLWGPWVILRKKTADGPFELYTDVESTYEHYLKIRKLFKFALILEIAALFLQIMGVLRGVAPSRVFACILAAIVLSFVREIAHLDDVLADLEGRLGRPVEENPSSKDRKISFLLPLGFLIGSLALLINEPVHDGRTIFDYIRCFLAGVACGLLFMGAVMSFWKRRK